MSLDVYLKFPGGCGDKRQAIFVREGGATKEITREEWDRLYPGREPATCDTGGDGCVYSGNITHNLGGMAEEAGIYKHLWRPEEVGVKKAADLIQPLRDGLAVLNSDPRRFEKHNPANGWGNYEGLVTFVAEYLAACSMYPDAEVSVWR